GLLHRPGGQPSEERARVATAGGAGVVLLPNRLDGAGLAQRVVVQLALVLADRAVRRRLSDLVVRGIVVRSARRSGPDPQLVARDMDELAPVDPSDSARLRQDRAAAPARQGLHATERYPRPS